MSRPAKRLPTLDEAVRLRLETYRSQRTVSMLRLYDAPALVRVRRAEPADAEALKALLDQYVAEGAVLPRSLEQIYRAIRDFVVVEDDNGIVGCGALKIYSAELAEVGALAVSPAMQGHGVGRRVVETLIEDARALGIVRVFALTMQVAFFDRLGFEPVSVTEFPQKVATDCAGCARRAHCPETAVARLV